MVPFLPYQRKSFLSHQINFFFARELLGAGFGSGGGGTGTELLGKNEFDRPPAPRVFRPQRRAIMLRDPPLHINRDPRIQRPI